ncbi:SDR family oxidoreductase [Streptomyces sp. MST-110588]|uniref:SDR family oxidoreductase n=1 Tax=Streptomyces sp. MST-110588 TaxID=2833628 RepID=UPI001F5D3482|nr:SDR family oxidoreductase [Streptomyces sp. MST-110588]UNO43057.1 SDR family oxidoreductase [Streptomyces sp. MST-110588]
MALTIDLAGRVALVTGGTRGVGAGIAGALLAAGAEVVICARRPPERPVRAIGATGAIGAAAWGDPSAGGVSGSSPAGGAGGRTARFEAVDLRDADAVGALLRRVREQYGRLDVLVNNAGGTPYRLLADSTPRQAARAVELNLLTPLTASLAAREIMVTQPTGGSIIMIGSVSGTRPSPGTAAYGAAKAGLENLARSMAVEWAPAVRVNTLVVGMVRTEQAHLHYGDAAGIAAVARTVPLGRLAVPADVGAACVFLAGDLSGYVTGASLLVHGGGERPAFLGASTATARGPDHAAGPRTGRSRADDGRTTGRSGNDRERNRAGERERAGKRERAGERDL